MGNPNFEATASPSATYSPKAPRRIGYVQSKSVFGAVEENCARVEELIGGEKADLWVLPELFSTGYQFQTKAEAVELAEPVPGGRTTRFLLRLAQERGCHIVAGLAEQGRDGKIYNPAVLVSPGGITAVYRKVHLFYKERLWFSPGENPFPVVDIGWTKVGLMICFDHLFPRRRAPSPSPERR